MTSVQFISFFRDLGWGVTAGVATLIIGAPLMYFLDSGETKKEAASRHERDTERADEARRGPGRQGRKAQQGSAGA